MNEELLFYLRSFSRFIYVVTDEEDAFLLSLAERLKKYEDQIFVFNNAMGLHPIRTLINDWANRAHQQSDVGDIHEALTRMYQEDPKNDQRFYVITDPERFMPDPQVQRRLLNLAHQLSYNERTLKIVMFVGRSLVIPPKLQSYIEVVHDKGMDLDQITERLAALNTALVNNEGDDTENVGVPQTLARSFLGLTRYQVNAAISQSIIATKHDPVNPRRVDPVVVSNYKRRQLQKTDLLSYVDVDGFTFDDVGGNDQFKDWARRTKASWTDKGQRFGLVPPKGVLAVGVWGCGKSLSVKAMGHAWGLPVVQMEMGRLRSSAVGESEANIYRAIRLIEAVSPCICWVDEAEKSLSGGQSSAMSDAGTTSRVIGILSNWLQETTAHVCMAMTANSLSTLPIEFVNRMDERFFFDLPSEDERIEILKIHLAKRRQDPARYNLAQLAEYAANMVGREIEQAIQASMIDSFEEGHDHLAESVLSRQLKGKPRIFKTMQDELREVIEWVGFDPDLQEGIRARFASAKRSETFKAFRSE